jgi:nucleotide-binding universal stress UspA family protein
VAVSIPVADGIEQFCSAACVDVAEREGRLRAAPPSLPELPSRIVVPTDGSGPALRAVERAVALAKATGGSVELLHALGGGLLRSLGLAAPAAAAERLGLRREEVSRALEDTAGTQLERSRRICEQAGVSCSTRVVPGAALDAIVEAAREADLVVMGSRGLDAVSGTLLGSLSQRVISSVKTPVLVVH